eukprot:855775_1
MSAITTFVFLCVAISLISTSQWIESNTSKLLRMDTDLAIGIYNGSIFLLGGNFNRRQLTEYVISDDIFIDHGATWISSGNGAFGYAQFCAQIQNILYMKDFDSASLSTFDMKTKAFTRRYINEYPITSIQMQTCVASSPIHAQLFVVGGCCYLSTVSVYNIPSSEWLNNVPLMQTGRSDVSCNVHPTTDTLYAIGGQGLSTIEIIHINDITNNNWEYIESLSEPLATTRSVIYRNSIYIIGGARWDDTPTDKVH